MEPKNTQRFSFTQAAAQQPERQRFSFSAAAPKPKKSPNQILDERFSYRGAVRNTASQLTSPPKRSVGQLAKEIFIPGRGYTDEEINQAKPTKKEFFIGAAKAVGEIGVGLTNLLHMGGNTFANFVLPGYDAESAKKARESVNEKVTPFITPKTVGEAKVMRTADIAGFAVGATKAGRLNDIKKALINAKTPDEARQLIRSADLSDEVIDRFKLDEAVVNIKNTKDADTFIKSVEEVTSTVVPNTPTVARQFSGTETGDMRDAIVRRFEEEIPTDVNGKPNRVSIIPEGSIVDDVEQTIRQLQKNPTPTISEINDAIQLLRLSGRRTDDLLGDLNNQIKSQSPTFSQRSGAQDIRPIREATPVSRIEQRFSQNFPEFKSAEKIAELRSRTRGTRSNEESLNAARELGYTSDRVLRIPEGRALNAEEKMAVSGVVESERMVLQRMEEGLKKLKPDTNEFTTLRAEASRQKVKVFQMMAVERGVAAEAGRALQAHKATVTAIERNESKLAKYLSSKKTPQETKDYIYRKIEEFDGSPDEMAKLLRELDEATLLEKFVEYATAAKLWNPTTQAVNLLTSLNRMFLQSPLHAISAVFDSILSKLTGRARERFISDAYAEVQGQYMGWKHAGHEALKALKDENYAFESRILKDFEVKGPAIKGRPGKNELRDQIANGFGKVVRIPFRMLGVEDMLIRKPSEMGALYTAINRKARMQGIKPGTKEWDDYVSKAISDPVGEYGVEFMREVQDIADQNLFQESLHPTLKRVSNWREDVPVLKLVVPFFRTIVNLQKQAIQFSALAPILPSARKALREGGGARSDVLAKMTLGTAATIPLVHHALEGNITMAAPTNPAERDAFYAEGKQPYSVKLGDSWYTYNRFSPFSEWFVTAGALAEAFNNDDEKKMSELTAHVFFSMTQNFFDKSFATGMHDLMEALNDPERAGNWLENFATGATIPNFIPLTARVIDPVIRETDDLKDAYISKVPYLSRTLDPKRDVFGKPISRPGNAIQKIVSPVIPSPVEVDMVRAELDSIGYQMGFPGKTAGGFEMDDETYRIYQAASGKIIYKALAQMIQNPGYQNLSPRQREQAVDKIVRESRELVKNQVAQEQLIMQQIKEGLKDKGYSSQQADDLAVRAYEIIKRNQEEAQGQ
jgi:hypothetical protein